LTWWGKWPRPIASEMKICLYGITGIGVGKHNLKDPRLDQADRLVEAKKKTYVQVETVDDKALVEADAILVDAASRTDLILLDLELVETRLGREPSAAEKAALTKLAAALENEVTVREAELSEEDRGALAVHSFLTSKPVVTATADELAAPEGLLLRVHREAGYISFLTVGGKENRAWEIRAGLTAWEAAGAIHSDIQKGFIRAEIISFQDFVEAGGETEAKRAGKQRLETKQYVMQDYDVVNFRFNK
jgi:ribosome-binding ATPase YchF (GTP1/OBG family)